MTQDCHSNCVGISRKTLSISPLKLSFSIPWATSPNSQWLKSLKRVLCLSPPCLLLRPHPTLTVFIFPWTFFISVKAFFSRYDLYRSFLTFPIHMPSFSSSCEAVPLRIWPFFISTLLCSTLTWKHHLPVIPVFYTLASQVLLLLCCGLTPAGSQVPHILVWSAPLRAQIQNTAPYELL